MKGKGRKSEIEVSDYVNQEKVKYEQKLKALKNEIISKLGHDAIDILKPKIHLPKGSPRKEISRIANKLEVDILVMGTVARTGIQGLVMGNTAETILNQIHCSVVAIKPPGFKSPI